MCIEVRGLPHGNNPYQILGIMAVSNTTDGKGKHTLLLHSGFEYAGPVYLWFLLILFHVRLDNPGGVFPSLSDKLLYFWLLHACYLLIPSVKSKT
jgi:hypothetical protein